MRSSRQWFYFLIIFGLLISSCQPLETMKVDNPPVDGGIPALVSLIINHKEDVGTRVTEENECLNCHSNKDQLIKTAEVVEEIAESESKGVG